MDYPVIGDRYEYKYRGPYGLFTVVEIKKEIPIHEYVTIYLKEEGEEGLYPCYYPTFIQVFDKVGSGESTR
jgi:hypothetical protein